MVKTKEAPSTTARRTADQQTEFAKVLFYGPPGSGKTSDLASMANRGVVIHIDAEAGVKPTALKRLNIDVTQLERFPDSERGEDMSYDCLDTLYWDTKARLDDDPTSVFGVMWDSVTETSKLLMESILAEGVRRTNAKGMERGQFDVYKEDWGILTEQMRHLIRRFRDLPCHVGFAGHARRDQDDDGRVKYGVALGPALQGDLHGYVDVICLTEARALEGWRDGEIFIGRFRAGGKYEVKDRFGLLPTEMVDPTMERIIAYINEELTADTDPIQQEGMDALKGAEVAAADEPKSGTKRPVRRPPPGARRPPTSPTPEAGADEE